MTSKPRRQRNTPDGDSTPPIPMGKRRPPPKPRATPPAAAAVEPAAPEPEVFRDKRLARFDHLGQTLVATVVVSSLSGPDSERLKHELIDRMRKPAPKKKKGKGPQPDEKSGARHIVFDLQNVQYMDSGCIGVLVELLTSIQKSGGRIAMVNTGHNVEYLFKLTRLDRLFPICRDVMRAIELVERNG